MSKFRELIGESYKVVRGYIPRDEVDEFSSEFIEDCEDGMLEKCASPSVNLCQDSGHSRHTLTTLIRNTDKVSEIFGVQVYPTYTIDRLYVNGSTLETHLDERVSSQIGCTVNYYSDAPWALTVENINGEVVEINLEPGDALFYDGLNTNHGRVGAYTGEKYLQVMYFHVFADGEYSHHYFDKVLTPPTVESSTLNGNTHVKKYDKFLPSNVCTALVEHLNEFDEIKDFNDKGEMVVEYDDPIQKVLNGYLNKLILTEKLKWLNNYENLKVVRREKIVEEYPINNESAKKIITVICLSDNHGGGTICSPEKDYIRLEGGDALTYPASFLYEFSLGQTWGKPHYVIIAELV